MSRRKNSFGPITKSEFARFPKKLREEVEAVFLAWDKSRGKTDENPLRLVVTPYHGADESVENVRLFSGDLDLSFRVRHAIEAVREIASLRLRLAGDLRICCAWINDSLALSRGLPYIPADLVTIEAALDARREDLSETAIEVIGRAVGWAKQVAAKLEVEKAKLARTSVKGYALAEVEARSKAKEAGESPTV